MAPAGPATWLKGRSARATVVMARRQATAKLSLPPKLPHTAFAQLLIGSVAICAPTSYPASCSRAKADLPRISPPTAHEKRHAALIAESVEPTTTAPYRIAGAAPVRTRRWATRRLSRFVTPNAVRDVRNPLPLDITHGLLSGCVVDAEQLCFLLGNDTSALN